MNLLYPLALLALVSLPIIFIISKIIPPNPKPQTLPAFDFLRGLNAQKSVVNDAPIWLKLLRALGILLLVLGLASPYFSSQKTSNIQTQNYLIIVEDGFSNANDFNNAKQKLSNFIKSQAAKTGASSQFTLIKTSLGLAQDFSVKSDISLLTELDNITPISVFNDYKGVNQALMRFSGKANVICLCDNSYHEEQEEFINRLKSIANGQITLIPPERDLLIIKDIKEAAFAVIPPFIPLILLPKKRYPASGITFASMRLLEPKKTISVPGSFFCIISANAKAGYI